MCRGASFFSSGSRNVVQQRLGRADLRLVVLQRRPVLAVVVGDLLHASSRSLARSRTRWRSASAASAARLGVRRGPVGEGLDHELQRRPLAQDLRRPLGRRHRRVAQPGQRDQGAGQPAVEGPRRERRDARRLDAAVERLVEDREPLVVRAVAGRWTFRSVTTRPGRSASRPTRLVAWMYSALVFGWPRTTIRPSRVMSRPTEIMFVAMATSTRSFSWNGSASRRLASATLSVLHAGGQLDDLVGDLAVGEEALRLARPACG